MIPQVILIGFLFIAIGLFLMYIGDRYADEKDYHAMIFSGVPTFGAFMLGIGIDGSLGAPFLFGILGFGLSAFFLFILKDKKKSRAEQKRIQQLEEAESQRRAKEIAAQNREVEIRHLTERIQQFNSGYSIDISPFLLLLQRSGSTDVLS